MSKSLILNYIEYFENCKILSRRELSVVLCILNHQQLKGGGVYGIDRLEERTGIKRNKIYQILKKLKFIKKKVEKNTTVFFIDLEEFKKFLTTNKELNNIQKSQKRTGNSPKKGLQEVPKWDLNESQNGTSKTQSSPSYTKARRTPRL
ncbi:hypothetical protein BLW93_07910 [Desulfurobacterium indicum]|uniref:Uncharacterized protein n=2 Tax=Desulfurobacterium indicum TaxID=1914305 RepID=A0A1R1MJG0_9BACT|nr:hypothetical protein BLW93_07910 [Desulfurobacterium indicum]